jgi:hypothetical protein
VGLPLGSTVGDWQTLKTTAEAASGTTTTLTLLTPFKMTGHGHGGDDDNDWCGGLISISGAHTVVTIKGNGAIFTQFHRYVMRFFHVSKGAKLVMSNVTLSKGTDYCGGRGAALSIEGSATLTNCTFVKCGDSKGGGAIYIAAGGNADLISCVFSQNGDYQSGNGGAILVDAGTVTLVRCTFSANNVSLIDCLGSCLGGAIYFGTNSTGVLAGCSFIGKASKGNNDIARDASAAVTFKCVDGLVGNSVMMKGKEISVIPPDTLHCALPKYSCDDLTGICKQDQSGSFPSKQACSAGCTARPTPAPCQVPRNCGDKNGTTVCGHTFTGCEFTCDFCCSRLYVLACDGCTEAKCKPVPPTPPPVTTKYFCVTTPNYHCIQSGGGTFDNPADCENACHVPLAPWAR